MQRAPVGLKVQPDRRRAHDYLGNKCQQGQPRQPSQRAIGSPAGAASPYCIEQQHAKDQHYVSMEHVNRRQVNHRERAALAQRPGHAGARRPHRSHQCARNDHHVNSGCAGNRPSVIPVAGSGCYLAYRCAVRCHHDEQAYCKKRLRRPQVQGHNLARQMRQNRHTAQ